MIIRGRLFEVDDSEPSGEIKSGTPVLITGGCEWSGRTVEKDGKTFEVIVIGDDLPKDKREKIENAVIDAYFDTIARRQTCL